MSPRLRQVLFLLVSVAFGGGLLWLALRGVDADAAFEALRTARYGWLPVIIALTAASLVVRAWRWLLLLEAVPAAGGRPPVTLGAASWAVTLGYGLNLVVPRAGEVARAGAVAARGPLGFAAVFGTVVVERVLDVIAFAAVLLLALALFADRLAALREPVAERLAALATSLPALGTLVLVGAVALVLLAALAVWALRRSGGGGQVVEKAREVARQFGSGLRTAWLVKRRAGVFGSTVLLWVLYAAMAYVPLLLLGLAEPYGLTFVDSWGLMGAGAFGMALPAPGGTGSFHYATVQAMDLLFGVPETPAATYAVVTHGVQVAFYAVGGLLAVVFGGLAWRAEPDAADAPSEPVASL